MPSSVMRALSMARTASVRKTFMSIATTATVPQKK